MRLRLMPARSRQDERGFFTIWTLALCGLVFAIGMLVLDFWGAFESRRELASIVDSAAAAGASQVNLANIREKETVLKPGDAAELNGVRAQQTALSFLERRADDGGIELLGTPTATISADNQRVTVMASTRPDSFMLRFLDPQQQFRVSVSSTATAITAQ